MSKEMYLAAHEQLIEEYMDRHPNADWQEAYLKTTDAAYDRYRENLADMIDHARMQHKYGVN